MARALRAIRRRKGWSQRQLGVRLGVSTSGMSRLETSALESCTVVGLEQWATALNAHVVLLLLLLLLIRLPATEQR